MKSPIPNAPLLHCLLLFDDASNFLPRFLERFGQRFPGAETAPSDWTSVAQPRPCAYGPLRWESWKWHILVDFYGMPPQVSSIMHQAKMTVRTKEAMEKHQTCCMLFLTEAPQSAGEAEHTRAVAEAAWCMLDAGAALLIWPRTGNAWHRIELEERNSVDFDPNWSIIDD